MFRFIFNQTHILTVWIPMFLPHWVSLFILQLRAIKRTQSKPRPVTLSSAIPHESPVFRVNLMTKLSTTAVCSAALLSAPSYHASTHVSVRHSDFSTTVWPAKFISLSLANVKSGLNPARPEACFLTFIYREKIHQALPVIEIHTREHPNTHAHLLMDTQQLHWTSRGLRCLAKRHFDGSWRRVQHHLLQADYFLFWSWCQDLNL